MTKITITYLKIQVSNIETISQVTYHTLQRTNCSNLIKV